MSTRVVCAKERGAAAVRTCEDSLPASIRLLMLSMLIDLRFAFDTLLITLFLRAEIPPPQTCVRFDRCGSFMGSLREFVGLWVCGSRG